MSENKTKATQQSVEDFLATADPKKKADSEQLIGIMERLSGEKATMWGPSIIGFGSYHYVYESGREGDMCRIGFSPRKDKFSLYLSWDRDGDLIQKLGKVKTSVACIYFKKLSDLDGAVLEQMIVESLADTKQKCG